MSLNESLKIKFIDFLKSWRILVLLFFILISIVAINYTSDTNHIVISGVIPGSAASNAGIYFDSSNNPRYYEKILSINNHKINSVREYYEYIKNLKPNSTIYIKTDRNPTGYKVVLPSKFGNESIAKIIGLSVIKEPSSNIRLGIDLKGGSRIILEPETNISDATYNRLIEDIQNRLDVYGASGTKVYKLLDPFSHKRYIVVESISTNTNDILQLISHQGKFVAKVGNKTAFTGNDVLTVFSDPQHAGLTRCTPTKNGEYICTYAFDVEISQKGADSFYNLTSKLKVENGYLSKKVCFYLDGQKITCLNIASVFKYQKITNPQITVSGRPAKDKALAIKYGDKQMKFLQTILSTQMLPTKLKVVQSYTISSSQGKELLSNAVKVGLIAILLVAIVIALRYRHWIVFLGIILTLLSEMIILFGASAFLRISIDLAAIGGIIAAIGTGVDDQIVITDEYFRTRKKNLSVKKRIKTAMFIITISYLATVAAMVPLLFAGLKILEGFAFTIIIGVSIGVFITRPAYAEFLKIMLTTREKRRMEKRE